MKVIKNEQVIMIDIDDTLVMWNAPRSDIVEILCPYSKVIKNLTRNRGNIKVLKDRKARGSTIVVWSAGGHAWAEAVVKALNLEEHVDYIMSKPIGYVDDKTADKILGEHIYIPYGSHYG